MRLADLELFRDRPAVVMVTTNYWRGIEYFGHHFSRYAAAEGCRTIFVERSPQRWPKLLGRDFSEWLGGTGQGAPSIGAKPVPERMEIFTPRWLPPSRWLRPLNRFIVQRDCARIRISHNEPAVVIFFPPTFNSLELLGCLNVKASAYINYFNYEHDGIMRDVLRSERHLIPRCDGLFAASEFCRERVRNLASDRTVYLCPHGVDYLRFSRAYRGDEPKRARTIYYFGGIGPHMDLDVYNSLAKRGYEVVMIGVVDPLVRTQVDPKIRLMPPVSNDVLPELLKKADVLLIAYRDNEYMRGVFPAKFFECLATGKPILYSGLRELDRYSDIVYNVAPGRSGISTVLAGLVDSENPGRIQARRDVAAAADWRLRCSRFAENLNTAWLTRQPSRR